MLCTSGFKDDVTFSYNGPNRPELKTTRMFRGVRQSAALVGRQATLFDRVCYVVGTRVEVCHLRPHLVVSQTDE